VKKTAAIFICMALLPVLSAAQGRSFYVIAGPAGVSGWLRASNTVYAAGGGEFGIGPVGIGGELGYWASGLGMGSVNGSVHPAGNASGQKVLPFLSAGYTVGFNFERTFNAANVGGGVNYWITNGLGLRLDFRDHIRPDQRGTLHYWSIRAGVLFR
jgi:hypothetical protein